MAMAEEVVSAVIEAGEVDLAEVEEVSVVTAGAVVASEEMVTEACSNLVAEEDLVVAAVADLVCILLFVYL